MFRNAEQSHVHSLQVLNTLYEYDDFMLSLASMIDLGCGQGLDLEWWATRTTRDEVPQPLNIHCTGVDRENSLSLTGRYNNVVYQQCDFESSIPPRKNGYDLLWCHDAFQYSVNPLGTLAHWWHIASPNAMLVLTLPQTTIIEKNKQAFYQPSGCYYNHTLPSLIYMLSTTGWDCGGGYFLKQPNDAWLNAVVYRSDRAPRDPKNTTWYDLLDSELLPETAVASIKRHGYLKQQDLTLTWLDKGLVWYGNQ